MHAKKWLPVFIFFCSLGVFPATAQVNSAAPRIAQAVNDSKLVILSGTVHPFALPQYDRGAAPGSLAMSHMLLVLKRSAQQQSALDSLLAEQQDPNSPNYHKWLTPAQFGAEFGPSDQDIATIQSWLQSEGFTVNDVSAGRTVIDFSGTAATVQAAFHTAIHRYLLPDGERHWANSTNIEIPAALSPVVAGVRSLNNFFPKPLHHSAVRPAFTYNFGASCVSATNDNCYDVTPGDFNTIYNVPASATGAGETIAIASDSDVVATDLTQFRSLFGLPAMTMSNSGNPSSSAPSCASSPCFVQFFPSAYGNPGVQCPDPGQVYSPPSCTNATDVDEDEAEAILDAEWAGATAPDASIWLVSSADPSSSTPVGTTGYSTTFGGDLSAYYIVNCPITGVNCPVAVPAHVLSDSYAECEFNLGSSGNMFYYNLWSQAATEGITVVVASGDSGSAGCDVYDGTTPQPAIVGLGVNGVASTPYDVAVGGTDFNQSSNPSLFWSATNSSKGVSALGYIPETTWNDSCTNSVFGSDPVADCNNVNNSGFVFTLGGGGGPSSCTTSTGTVSSCSAPYPKPCWQMATLTAPCTQPGASTLNDGDRDIPDISFFAGNSFSGSAYIVCEADTPAGSPSGQAGIACSLATPPANAATQSSYEEVGGTSVSAQAFAGIAALIDQQGGGTGQGSIDQYLYNIAGQAGNTCTSAASPASTCVFYDVTAGTISQPCDTATVANPPCVTTGGDPYGVLESGGQLDYNAGAGYDYATGLGSINISNLFCKAAALTCTTTALQAAPATITFGQSTTLTATVAPQAGSGTPTGTVNFLDGSTNIGNGTLNGSGVATFSTTTLAVGTHSITAAYQGDTSFAASTSSAVPVQVNAAPAPDFSVAATPASQSVTPGQSTSYTLTLSPLNGFNQAVTIACSGAPTDSTCSPASSPVTLNGSAASQVQINVTTTAASLLPPGTHPFGGWRMPAVLASLMLLCLLIADRFHRQSIALRRWLAGAACATAIAFVLVGCGGGNKSTPPPTNGGTPAGTSTLTLTCTSGSTTHTTTVSLVVQ